MNSLRRFPFWVYLSVAFVLLQIGDGVLTCTGLYLYGSDLEANPLAAQTFQTFGLVQMALVWKVASIILFFGVLGYSLYVRYSLLDLIDLLRGRTPQRRESYSMAGFYVFGTVALAGSLYAVIGWIYILATLSGTV